MPKIDSFICSHSVPSSLMAEGGDALQPFRNMRLLKRETEKYSIFRAIYMKLQDMAATVSPLRAEQEKIIQDLENIAVKRAIEQYGWMKDDYIWSYSHKTRKTEIRSDLKQVLENRIVRNDELLRNFLINSELLKLTSEFNFQSHYGLIATQPTS